jgi:hypothetical protein
VFSNDDAGTAMRVLAIVWASITAVNLAVWTIISVTTGDFPYPWWLWLSVPGAALLVLYAAGVGRPRR